MAWEPIATVPHDELIQVQLWSEYSNVYAWWWSNERNRWEGQDGLYWPEGDLGPTHWCPMAAPPVATVVDQPISRYALETV